MTKADPRLYIANDLEEKADQMARDLADIIRKRQGQGPLSKSDSADTAWQVVREFIGEKPKGQSAHDAALERAKANKAYWIAKAAQSPSKFRVAFERAREADLEIKRLEDGAAKTSQPATDDEKGELVRTAHEFVRERRRRNRIVGP